MDAPTGLPRLSQDYTAEQKEVVVGYLASLSVDELRERQAILNGQRRLITAVTPEDLAVDLDEKFMLTTDALARKVLQNAR